jgi:hypothetical protein
VVATTTTSRADGLSLASVNGAAPPRLTIEILTTRNPLHGRLLLEGGDARPFTGWLGLLSALELRVSELAECEREPGDAGRG